MHEQTRSDRDQYITINLDNIQSGMAPFFAKCENCDLQGLPYDVHSIMHYHQFAFAINRYIPTIRTLDGTSGQYMGQRDGFSALDIEGINMIYCGK